MIRPLKLRKVGRLRVRAGLQSTANANQIRDAHVRRERIAARFPNFALDIDRGWFDCVRISMNQEAISRL